MCIYSQYFDYLSIKHLAFLSCCKPKYHSDCTVVNDPHETELFDSLDSLLEIVCFQELD